MTWWPGDLVVGLLSLLMISVKELSHRKCLVYYRKLGSAVMIFINNHPTNSRPNLYMRRMCSLFNWFCDGPPWSMLVGVANSFLLVQRWRDGNLL